MSVAAGYLLDTNVISETRKVRADAGVMGVLAGADSAGLFLSVLTLGELRKGVEARRPHRCRERCGSQRMGGEHRSDFRRSTSASRCRCCLTLG